MFQWAGLWRGMTPQAPPPPQLQADLQRRLREDPDFSPRRFPNAHRAFNEGPPRGPTQ